MTVMHQIKIRCDRCKTESVVINTESREQARQLAAYDHRWRAHVPHTGGMWNDICPTCQKDRIPKKENIHAHQ